MKQFMSYAEAQMICAANPNFTEKISEIDGFKVSLFTYGITTTAKDFLEPIPGANINALEIRGCVYVHNADGTHTPFPLLKKFFNFGENISVQPDLIAKLKLKSSYAKEDGSITSFVKLPNGKVIARSKTSFESDQANRANAIYRTNDNLRKLVDNCLSNNIVPIFEYVAEVIDESVIG